MRTQEGKMQEYKYESTPLTDFWYCRRHASRSTSIYDQTWLIEPPADRRCIARESMNNVTSQAIDFPYPAKLLWAEADYFSGLETAVIEQIGDALFPHIRQQAANGFPY